MKKNIPKIFIFEFSELNVTNDMLRDVMGYNDSIPAQEILNDTIKDVMMETSAVFDIRGGYVVSEDLVIDSEKKKIYSRGQWFDTKQIVTHQLRRSERAAWFVCTAGEEISQYSRKHMKEGDMMKGYAADVLANIVVDRAMDKIQEVLKAEQESMGLKITNRYSPGYCDWDINEQKKLFQAFPENFLDITLNESCLMIPTKSISGIIGIGREVKYNEYTCNLCKDVRCTYRNKPGSKFDG